MIFASLFFIASAALVTAQSNLNCGMYPRGVPPAGDYVDLFNSWGNDSHVQYANLSEYPYAFGCNSTITALDDGCSGNYVNVAQLYRANDSHVSVDNFYPREVCFNTSNSGLGWYFNVSATGATPADYECVFAIGKYNDTHVWECDHADADFNVNLKINSTAPPNTPPVASNVILNSTYGTNYTNENLTVYWDASDADADNITNITNWYLNSASIAVLNMPFEANGANESSWTKDYTNFSNHGTVSGATWNSTGGHDGWGAYEFDGTGADIVTPISTTLQTFTYEAWIDPHQPVPGFVGEIISKRSYYATAYDDFPTSFSISDSGSLVCRIDSGDDWNTDLQVSSPIAMDQWHHVACTYSSPDLVLYVDGEETARNSSAVILSSNSRNYTIGRASYENGGGVGTSSFNGTMDAVRIYSRALSAGQIKALYGNRTDLILSQETRRDDVWQACVTPNDGIEDGAEVCSNPLDVKSTNPHIANIELNSTYGTNNTAENLTVWYDSLDDAGLTNKNMTNWFLNGSSIAVMNLPFERSDGYNETNWTKDYSTGPSNHGIVAGAAWNATGGHDGWGAYEFDGNTGEKIVTPKTDVMQTFTYSAWIKPHPKASGSIGEVISKRSFYASGTTDLPVAFWTDDAADTVHCRLSDGFDYVFDSSVSAAITPDVWNHVSCTYENPHLAIYVNGVKIAENDTPVTLSSNIRQYTIGEAAYEYAGGTGLSTFNGTIDDVLILNRSLSAEQVKALYENKTDLIVSQETSVDDTWQACVTPNDGYEDGAEACSNTVVVNDGCIDGDGDGAYSYSSLLGCSGFRDCDDSNSSLYPPYDDMSITQDTWLCNGTYQVNDSGTVGVVLSGLNGVSLTCLGTTLVGNSSGAGFRSSHAGVLITGCNASNYSVNYRFWSGSATEIQNSTSWYGNQAIYFSSGSNNVSGFTSYYSLTQALYLSGVSGNNITDSALYYGRSTGVYLLSGANNNFFMNLSVINHTSSVYIFNSNGNTFRNCTLQGNSSLYKGIEMKGASSDNLFYYDSIFGTYGILATSELSDNHFNTTHWNGTDYVAHGNYWGDILSLDIYDSDYDGFGDSGPDYPYNSTNGGNVNVNVVDWGPITTKTFEDSTPPNGTIVIYGPNGTITTGTRSVFLNLTYDDDVGVDKCRWANDDPANLTAQPWEECTTVKAWLLSEGEGNKTVYYQVKDIAGNNATFNDSILYYYTQEYTPPGAPVIYDGLEGDDIDWWNSNSTLHAHWDASGDDISTVRYKYRIINQTGCLEPSCAWTDVGTATEATAEGLTLYEGANYSFEVLAYVSPAINSRSVSDGAIIDLTRPDTPIVNSSTHPDQDTEYGESTADLNWTASDIIGSGVESGIEGYSYILDRYPGTAPDEVMEERFSETITAMRKGSYNQTLKANSTGYAYAVFKQLNSNFTENETVQVKVAMAERFSGIDDDMDISVSLIKVTQGAGIDEFDEPDKIADTQSISQDIAYAADMSLAHTYTFDLAVNETVDDTTNDIYVVVSGIASDDDNTHDLAISGVTSNLDASASRFVCDESDACTDTTAYADYAIEVMKADSGDEWETQYQGLADGTYYFHVKAKDNAGNWGDTAHYRINVAAGGVSISIASPADGEIFTTEGTDTNISVKVVVSGNASVEVIALHPDGSNYTSPPAVFTTTNIFHDIRLESGQNEIYAVATTAAGAVSRSSSVYVTVAPSVFPTTNRTLRVTYTGGGAYVGSYLTHATEGSAYVGIATENSGAVAGGGDIMADTELNTIKIFATKPFKESGVENDLEDNGFLDRKVPSFGFSDEAHEFIISNELRYEDVFLGGKQVKLSPGRYSIYLNHGGVTQDGKVNLTITVE